MLAGVQVIAAEAAPGRLDAVAGGVEHRLGMQVDDTAGGIGRLDGTGALEHFKTVQIVNVDVVEAGEAVRVGHGHAIADDHDFAHPVAGLQPSATDDQTAVVAVAFADGRHARNALERVVDIAGSALFNRLLVHHRDGVGHFAGRGFHLGGGDADGLHLFGQSGGRYGCEHGCGNKRSAHDGLLFHIADPKH